MSPVEESPHTRSATSIPGHFHPGLLTELATCFLSVGLVSGGSEVLRGNGGGGGTAGRIAVMGAGGVAGLGLLCLGPCWGRVGVGCLAVPGRGRGQGGWAGPGLAGFGVDRRGRLPGSGRIVICRPWAFASGRASPRTSCRGAAVVWARTGAGAIGPGALLRPEVPPTCPEGVRLGWVSCWLPCEFFLGPAVEAVRSARSQSLRMRGGRFCRAGGGGRRNFGGSCGDLSSGL